MKYSKYRMATLAGVVGVAMGLLANFLHYQFADFSLWGYQFFMAPAMLALSFFSEELPFTPKLVIYSFGQFIGYFAIMLVLIRLKRSLPSQV
ncbi:hypothetical protein [Colwellia sp. MEBiC06753]